MPAGHSCRRLVEKLDVKPGPRAHVRGAAEGYEDVVLANGMVDVKVCAVDEVWSGLELMFRRADRAARAS